MKICKAEAALLAMLFLFFAVTACAAKKTNPKEENRMNGNKLSAVLERHKNELMAIPGVTGVAEGRCSGRPCIKVYVAGKTPETGKIPSEVEGFPVRVEETGGFKPLPEKGK